MKARFHPVTDLELERYLADDLSDAERQKVEAQVAQRPDVQAYLAQRRAEKEAFRAKQPPLPVLLSPRARPVSRSPWPALAAVGLALAASLALVVLTPQLRGDESSIAARGRPKITVVVLRGDSLFEYREGVLLTAGDRIRLTVESPSSGYVTVIGRDSNRMPVVHYENVKAMPGSFIVPDSLELDDSPGPEELLVFFTAEPIRPEEKVEALTRGEPLGSAATVLELAKEPAP
jgi:hypothetical protein